MTSDLLLPKIEQLEKALEVPITPDSEGLARALVAQLMAISADAPAEVRETAIRGLLAADRQCYRAGDLALSARILDAAQSLSDGLMPAHRLRVLLRRADFELLIFDVGAALEFTASAMELARLHGLRIEEARAWTYYGMALNAAGMKQEADERFAHALELLKDQDEPRLCGNIWAIRIPVDHVDIANAEAIAAAEHACAEALRYAELSPPESRDSMVCTAWCNWAALEMIRGNVDAARDYLRNAGAQANLGLRPRWLIAVIGAMADIRGDNSAEHRAALETLLLPDPSRARVYVIESYSVMARMFTLIGDHAHANLALTRLSMERANALSALLHVPEILPATSPPLATTPAVIAEASAHARHQTTFALLERLAITAELRDDSTGKHCFRVGRMSMLLARRAGLPEELVARMDLAARLHDIGKIAIPDAILLKPGRLDEVEVELMRTHTTVGADLLAGGSLPLLRDAENIARHHHEFWNGKGYPAGLAGKEIPIAARIAALADVYDALTHPRPYKQAWSRRDTLDHIERMRGVQFDPQLTDLFIAMMSEAEPVWEAFYATLEGGSADSPFIEARRRLEQVMEEAL
jgi:HD-GYP domain-containing protein (c-di-GMP phosphodiesterase class II)